MSWVLYCSAFHSRCLVELEGFRPLFTFSLMIKANGCSDLHLQEAMYKKLDRHGKSAYFVVKSSDD